MAFVAGIHDDVGDSGVESKVDATRLEEGCNRCYDSLVEVDAAFVDRMEVAQPVAVVHEAADIAVELGCAVTWLETEPMMQGDMVMWVQSKELGLQG